MVLVVSVSLLGKFLCQFRAALPLGEFLSDQDFDTFRVQTTSKCTLGTRTGEMVMYFICGT